MPDAVLGAGEGDALHIASGSGDLKDQAAGVKLNKHTDEVCGGLVSAVAHLKELVFFVIDAVALGAIGQTCHALRGLHNGLVLRIRQALDGMKMEFFAAFEMPNDGLIAELS